MKSFAIAVIGVFGVWWPLLAEAQVHMCTDANGHKVFSDHPCGENSKLIDVRPSTGSTGINPSTSMQTAYYDVAGLTLAELRRDIAKKGPEGWWGMASTKIGYNVTTKPTAGGCVVDTIKTSADATVRLPRWRNRHEATVDMQQQVDVAFRSLELHERGHVQISLNAARQIERTVREVPPGPTCQAVADEATRRAEAVLASSSREQQLYDSETDHGVNQYSPYRSR